MDKQQIADYSNKKESGIITIAKVGDDHAITVKTFSRETGEELHPEVYTLSIAALKNQKAELVKEVNDLEGLITDLEILK